MRGRHAQLLKQARVGWSIIRSASGDSNMKAEESTKIETNRYWSVKWARRFNLSFDEGDDMSDEIDGVADECDWQDDDQMSKY